MNDRIAVPTFGPCPERQALKRTDLGPHSITSSLYIPDGLFSNASYKLTPMTASLDTTQLFKVMLITKTEIG